jgi:ferrochelatase
LDRASAADPDPGSRGYVVSVGMRHTTPTISAALEHAAESGARLVVAVIMASHQSDRATGAYVRDLESAYDALPPGLRRRTERPLVVPPWHMSPKYLRAVADRVQEALSAVDDVSTSGTPVLFTAHSLPLDEGQGDEQYEAALEETARGVMGLIGPLPWRLAYQSASPVRSVRWLGPSVDEVLRELARAGARDVVVTPLGFVSEHLETLYDLDVELAEVARGAGLHMIRAQTVGASPVFAEALADAIRACAARDVAPDVGDRSATAEEVG